MKMNRFGVLTKVLQALTIAIITATATTTATTTTTPTIPVRRYLLSIGVNDGGAERVMLRYAVSDAAAFAAVLTDMGGVEPGNAIVLSNPNGRRLLGGIADLSKLLAKDRAAEPDMRGEVFVYYSGHADEGGLKIGAETLSWVDFRNAVNGLEADVKVAVVDACGSGAITRTKGGVARPAFLSDVSSNMKGYAFLTSSNENEASQESDRLKGSYFTHALLSGMRGAADMTGDGKVTVNEAYQYAFNETLQSTQNTRSGTQHPSRDMNLAGTGDVVMTDLRETSAALLLDANIEGRFFIRDESGNLFAELRKFRGRAIELGMPPGKYSIQMEAPSRMWMAGGIEIVAGERTALSMNDMRAMERKTSVARGDNDVVDNSIGIDDVDTVGGIDGIVADGNGDSVAAASVSTTSGKSIASTMATSPPPADSSVRGRSTSVLANPLLDSACRAPYRMNVSVVAGVNTKPESGFQIAIFANAAGAEFCGTQISGIVNVANKDMNGTQLNPIANIAAGRFNGMQVSTINFMKNGGDAIQVGAVNAIRDSIGWLQAGSVNISRGEIGFLQAGPVNIAKNVGYVQAGSANIAKSVGYVQAGPVNIAKSVGYVQAGATNIAQSVGYVQAGATNIAQSVGYVQAGATNIAVGAKIQAGAVNIAKNASRQFGAVNIAARSEKTPIGLINIIGNGIFELSYYAETYGLMGVSARTGTPWLYTLFEYSQPVGPPGDWPKASGLGVGTRFGMPAPFYVNLDVLQMTFYDEEFFGEKGIFNGAFWKDEEEYTRRHTNSLIKARLGLNYAPIRYLAFSGGACVNGLIAGRGGELLISATGSMRSDWRVGDRGAKMRVWPGLYAGVTGGIVRWK